jgi:hypothetical protein
LVARYAELDCVTIPGGLVCRVRLALDDLAERMLGPVPVVVCESLQQEWPG